jgi:GTP-binding protein
VKSTIGIVGRPNVGKSTLFNRLLGYKKAITEDSPGVTRDRNYGEFEYGGAAFLLVDTGGFEPANEEGFFPLIKRQIEASVSEAAALLFVVDFKAGLLPQDREIVQLLRRTGKPVLVVVNKVDSPKGESLAGEFYELGTESLYPISALHGTGMVELLDAIVDSVPHDEGLAPEGDGPAEEDGGKEGDTDRPGRERRAGGPVRIAFVGRPNTGKSSLVNALLGSERMIVSDVPGTTRDAIDSTVLFRGKELVIVDTAGLRRKSRVSIKVEEYSVSSAVKSIEQADVVNLVLDAAEGISHQDGGIAHLVTSRGKGLVIVVNKWDLAAGRMTEGQCRELVAQGIPHGSHAPVVLASAKTGLRVTDIPEKDLKVYGQLNRRIGTPRLNESLREFLQRQAIPRQRGKEVKILYAHQSRSFPPTFTIFANHPHLVPENYKRYLENSLRRRFGFQGAPIRFVVKKK